MTVCIAAICDEAQAIVAVCDQKISSGIGWATDNQALKLQLLAENCYLLWASNDIGKVPPVLDSLKQSLRGKTHSAVEVGNTLSQVYQEQIRREAENRYLGRFGLSMGDFLKKGANCFTSDTFEDMKKAIDQVCLESDFIVFGFDQQKKPYILRMGDPGNVEFYDGKNMSFCTIGSGRFLAESPLFFHEVSWMTPLPEAIYHVCEAKFMAETASGVGRVTFGMIAQGNGHTFFLPDHLVEKIRDLWKAKGRPRLPEGAVDVATEVIEEAGRFAAQWKDRSTNSEPSSV